LIWAPNEVDWWEAGVLVAKVGARRGWEASKRRDFQNDVLIALTARRYGAAVVTSNRADFEIIAKEMPLRLWLLGAS
jgi:predicted nucleic acid-binding protein